MKISVGVTCYNNGDNIDHLLTDIEEQVFTNREGITEIIVVASGCTDETVTTVRQFQAVDPRIRLIVEGERCGKPSAINKITRAMSGDVLVLLSGDVRLFDTGFVEGLVKHCTDGTSIVGCRPVPVNGINAKGGYIGHLIWDLHDKTLMAQIAYGMYRQAGEAFAIRRNGLEVIPPNVINDDAYLVLKAQMTGRKFAYAREITVQNRTPERIQDLLLQRRRIICGHRQLKGIMGESPNVLYSLVLRRPLVAANVVVQEIREQISRGTFRVLWILELVALELAAHLLARIWDPSNLWPTAESAKWPREGTGKRSYVQDACHHRHLVQ